MKLIIQTTMNIQYLYDSLRFREETTMKILITGGTHGIGKGVAKVLSAMDNQEHEIIILCRSSKLAEAVKTEFERITSNKKVSYVLCDLSRLSDVRKTVQEIQSKHSFLDAIFINAGIGYSDRRVVTADGMDSHFQVNYLSQFMLTVDLLDLLRNSKNGGRVIFNVTNGGSIFWDDLQMQKSWRYEDAIKQAMVAKRMFLSKLDRMERGVENSKLSFIGFQVPKTVWTNQISFIPVSLKIIVTVMRIFGKFMSIEECGEIMAPLFTETQEESLKKSGKFITWKNNRFVSIDEDIQVLSAENQEQLWEISLKLTDKNEVR